VRPSKTNHRYFSSLTVRFPNRATTNSGLSDPSASYRSSPLATRAFPFMRRFPFPPDGISLMETSQGVFRQRCSSPVLPDPVRLIPLNCIRRDVFHFAECRRDLSPAPARSATVGYLPKIKSFLPLCLQDSSEGHMALCPFFFPPGLCLLAVRSSPLPFYPSGRDPR